MEETKLETAKDEPQEEKPLFDMYCKSCWKKLPSDAELCTHCKDPDPFYYKKLGTINTLCVLVSILATIALGVWGYYYGPDINWDDYIIIKNEILALILALLLGIACFTVLAGVFWICVTIICLFLEFVFFGFFIKRCERHMRDIFYDKKDPEGFEKWKKSSDVVYWS